DRRNIALIGAVDEDMALRRGDQERAERRGADIIDVADDLVRGELRHPIRLRAHVACQDRSRRIGLPSDSDRRMIGRRWVLGEGVCRWTKDKSPEETCERAQPGYSVRESVYRNLRLDS